MAARWPLAVSGRCSTSTVPDVESLVGQRDRATDLGAAILLDRSENDEEPLFVFADPVGHPFCIFVG